jgi:hypothetical protein
MSSLFSVDAQEYDGYEYDEYGDGGTTHIIIKNDQQAVIKNGPEAIGSETKIIKNDQQAIGSGDQPNVQNCAQNNIEAIHYQAMKE